MRPENVSDDVLILDDFERRHIIATLRKELNDTIFVTDGQGILYTGTIKKTGPPLLVEIQKKEKQAQKSTELILACGFIKQNRMDFILEKGTELGVRQFVFFRSRFTNYFSANQKRFHKVIRQALKQSLRFYLPQIRVFPDLESFFKGTDIKGLRLVAIGAAFPTLREVTESKQNASQPSTVIAVGPEGGFSEEEVQQFEANKFLAYSLGPQRLRTETAAIASVAIVSQYIH